MPHKFRTSSLTIRPLVNPARALRPRVGCPVCGGRRPRAFPDASSAARAGLHLRRWARGRQRIRDKSGRRQRNPPLVPWPPLACGVKGNTAYEGLLIRPPITRPCVCSDPQVALVWQNQSSRGFVSPAVTVEGTESSAFDSTTIWPWAWATVKPAGFASSLLMSTDHRADFHSRV